MIGLTPVPFVAFQSWTAPAMLPWSVSVTAGISNSAACSTRSGTRQAPSRIEYSEWTWRWTKGAAAIGRDSLRRPPDGSRNGSVVRLKRHPGETCEADPDREDVQIERRGAGGCTSPDERWTSGSFQLSRD